MVELKKEGWSFQGTEEILDVGWMPDGIASTQRHSREAVPLLYPYTIELAEIFSISDEKEGRTCFADYSSI